MQTLQTSDTDTYCREILQRYADGQLSDIDTRKALADALHRSGIAATVAGEKPYTSHQQLVDVTAEMEELMVVKMMQQTKGGYDLQRGLDGASVTGWARQLLRVARNSISRNLRTGTDKYDLVEPIVSVVNDEIRFRSRASMVFHTQTREESAEMIEAADAGQRMLVAADWLSARKRHLRDNSRLEAQAASLTHAYDIPALDRPRLEERRRLSALLTEDPSLAHRSVTEMYRLVGGDADQITSPVDPGFLPLWDDFAYNNLEAIATTDPKVALTLVEAVLADRVRPSRTTLRSFRAAVKSMGPPRNWSRVADEVCESFIALEFEAYSSFDSTGSEYREQRIAGRSIAVMKAPEVFARALKHKGQRLGTTEQALYAQLDQLIRNLTDVEVKAPASAAAA
ncbi:hypothetical protein [Pseudarthrobacter sp. BIM B-2242]|uniref:hypothetical protein n=1 Tax=Pseudarthrobacter sp. BIM B-2242 TaxID=2772401 RepID=UPI001CC4DBCF|nr:hypothetical protein [Pseudarthrobacter sp. BIM B-2242]